MRIRNRGLSAKEIVTCRDQATGKQLNVDDGALSDRQAKLRNDNHQHTAKSKSPHGSVPQNHHIARGSLVYIKSEGDKFTPRDLYIVVKVDGENANIQKFRGGSFMSTKYIIPLNRLYPMRPGSALPPPPHIIEDSSDNEENFPLPQQADERQNGESTEEDQPHPPSPVHMQPTIPVGRPVRNRNALDRFGEWVEHHESDGSDEGNEETNG